MFVDFIPRRVSAALFFPLLTALNVQRGWITNGFMGQRTRWHALLPRRHGLVRSPGQMSRIWCGRLENMIRTRQSSAFLVKEIWVDQRDRLGIQRLEQRIGIVPFSSRDIRHPLDLCPLVIFLGGIVDCLHSWRIIDDVGHMRIFAYQEADSQQKLHL